MYLSPRTGLPRGIFNNSLIQDAETKNKWTLSAAQRKDATSAADDDESMQKTVEPMRETPLKAAYKPALSPKTTKRQVIKRSPYTNTL